ALPLARALAACGESIYLSHTRADALDIGFDLQGSLVGRGIAPFDHPWCSGAALRRVAPRAVVLVETELWPNGIRAATDRGICVGVVSASISPRSFERYSRFASFIRPTFERLSFVGAQTGRDAERFVVLGTPAKNVEVTGDLKRDMSAAGELVTPPTSVVSCIAGRRVFMAGSTHEGEEAAVLEAYAALRSQRPDSVCVIAPRRIGRAGEVAALARGVGLQARLRSAGDSMPLREGEILILDTLGELASCYATASVAFVGGSLVPAGGHNLYEPLRAGALVFHGPQVSSAARELAELGLVHEVASGAELGEALCKVLGTADAPRDPRAEVERQLPALSEAVGAAARNCALVERHLRVPA
ncbi:MAG: glycosyltransferase N-terminal domain-containing protein, partial [Myxococcota bacterium]|nr:glycosyltransferase N-terminal domain-containing protein [Myxococcota bacterium]